MKEIKELLTITEKLRNDPKNHGRTFTLDGKLVGDIGEVLAAEKYGLDLLPHNNQVHDAKEKSTERLVQIKSSFKNNFYFPYKHVPKYYLCINILENGEIEEVYNGTGKFVLDNYAKNLKHYNETYYTLAKGKLFELNKIVPKRDKIKMVK
jgi:hypothetical protein